MFGHFKAEEFLNLIEGSDLAAERRNHLAACAACRTRLESVQSVHSDLSLHAMEAADNIPEPDWDEFRSSVRMGLMSRAVKRESSVRRPALAWALSFGFVICLMAGGFLWHLSADRVQQEQAATVVEPTTTESQEPALDIATDVDPATIEAEKAVWSNSGVFEEVAQLRADQAERLRVLLEQQ